MHTHFWNSITRDDINLNSNMAKRRAHKTLSLADKIKIIQEINRGQSGKLLADKYGVGTSTICDIKKNSENIRRFAENSDEKLLKQRKTLKTGEYEEFEQKLYAWFEEKRSRHQTISAGVLRQKAKSLYQKMYNNESFKASDGWFQKFKKRFSVRNLKICGESLSAKPDLVPAFQNELYNVIEAENLLDDQIYNADESGLFWKMFPDKTLVHFKEKSAPGTKMSKERITFLCCANKTGSHKLQIAVVGKSKNPRSFKKQRVIEYYSSKNAWMTTYIFTEWFFKSFIPQVKNYQTENNLPKKGLLILDNATCHGEPLASECGKYRIMFLPPNCTSIIQPMDQNVIRLTKLYYKKYRLCELVNSESDSTDIFLKQFSMYDACELLKRSWNRVSDSTLKSCWKNIHTQRWASEDNIPLSVLQQELPESDFSARFEESEEFRAITNLFRRNTDVELSEDEVLAWINDSGSSVVACSSSELVTEDEEAESNMIKRVKNREAVQALNISIDWAKQRGIDTDQILVLKEMRNKALEACVLNQKQTCITNFVKKTS
ncbi:jerky protein homolog-like [Bactrocera neohumeralis]|uniref:jerky protein homolog-like n=1 Tax=Bactrocera neohumeralis TaxID=98809 RepID=UPI0021659D04|nr:jerky protein homolog-like [Bactrocera neohumeralis]XP_050330446.1 jerky protein homolog-like [Bactrocera neohumeralis]